MSPLDKTLAKMGFVRFRGPHGPVMVRIGSVDSIVPANDAWSTLFGGFGCYDLMMDASAAQERLAAAAGVRDGNDNQR